MRERGRTDYHIHSSLSAEGKSAIHETYQNAIRLGIREIGIAEHMDFEPTDLACGFFDYDRYTSEISNAHLTFGGKLVVRKGG